MNQEHKFCADVYHAIYAEIDHSKRVLFCLDGAAAREAHRNDEIEDECVPDLCFTIIGSSQELRIEAKIIERRRVRLSSQQKPAWCHNGCGKLLPHVWIAANSELTEFWFWEHETFCKKIAQHVSSKGPLLVYNATSTPPPLTFTELINSVLDFAKIFKHSANAVADVGCNKTFLA